MTASTGGDAAPGIRFGAPRTGHLHASALRPLAGRDDQHARRRPRHHGGTRPHQPLARSIAEWLVPSPSPTAGWTQLPANITVTSRSPEDGTRILFVHNWSWQPPQVAVPADLSDQRDLRGRQYARPGAWGLGPGAWGVGRGAWDVRVPASSPSPIRHQRQ